MTAGSLGSELDSTRWRILVIVKLVYEARFNLREVGSVVSSPSAAALLLCTMHYSAIYGEASQWLPHLSPYFYAAVWLVPYYNACIGCTVSPQSSVIACEIVSRWLPYFAADHFFIGTFAACFLAWIVGDHHHD